MSFWHLGRGHRAAGYQWAHEQFAADLGGDAEAGAGEVFLRGGRRGDPLEAGRESLESAAAGSRYSYPVDLAFIASLCQVCDSSQAEDEEDVDPARQGIWVVSSS